MKEGCHAIAPKDARFPRAGAGARLGLAGECGGRQDDTAAKIGLKAFRGLSNTVLGLVTDIPRTMYYDSLTEGPGFGLTVGFFEGIAFGVGRTLVGVYELVTFPVPFPADYQPILAPGDPFGEGKTKWAQ